MEVSEYVATGRRKRAVARVRLSLGKGEFKVNGKDLNEYFQRQVLIREIMQPIEITESVKKYDIIATVNGGGLSGQAGALRLGIARAIIKLNPSLRTVLKIAGFLTRDPREKERKKYGQRGARARFQFSKR